MCKVKTSKICTLCNHWVRIFKTSREDCFLEHQGPLIIWLRLDYNFIKYPCGYVTHSKCHCTRETPLSSPYSIGTHQDLHDADVHSLLIMYAKRRRNFNLYGEILSSTLLLRFLTTSLDGSHSYSPLNATFDGKK